MSDKFKYTGPIRPLPEGLTFDPAFGPVDGTELTHGDVWWLECLARTPVRPEVRQRLLSIAERIAATLPPEGRIR